MKYIDADKLLAEIERQKKAEGWCEVGKDTADVYYARGFRFACDNLLSFITALQQAQQPDAEEITPIMAEYVADVFSRKEHLDNISYGYCMEISAAFRRYAERAKQKQSEVDL